MIPPLRHAALLNGGTIVLLLVALLMLDQMRRAVQRAALRRPLPIMSQDSTASPQRQSEPVSAWAWHVLQAPEDAVDVEGALARRFRLAGTLFGFGVGSAEAPQAILDDKVRIEQRLVRRGDEVIPGVRLVEVRTEFVTLEGPRGSEVLRLERFQPSMASPDSPGRASEAEDATASHDPSAFGGREVFPGRWEFDRQTLLDYYDELRREPERLLSVFDSMEPLWQDNDPSTRVITGYRLNVQGEASFFEAMGMRPQDVVRAVNAVEMTNRRRAESFIRSFVEGHEDTFVIEVERDGDLTKQVYIIQ